MGKRGPKPGCGYLKDKTYEEVFGIERSKEIKKKMSEAKQGKYLPKEHIQKIKEALKGHNTSLITRRKISEANKGKHSGIIPWNKGKPWSKEIREKISESCKGKKVSEETKRKLSKSRMGHIGYTKGKKLTKEHIKKCLRRRIPTSLEKKFQGILDKYNLPYRYVGNGEFFIERCNPDFINTNSEKIAVEVYARFYKQLNGRDIERWKERRTKIFKKYGWNIIFFNEVQVNEDYVLAKLKTGGK